ncbi:Alpha/Beta hydrolase protein [Xylaria flabelliformis]|nr:Alpha/Beta hydrolase protein [Xylaria flabelliformis]
MPLTSDITINYSRFDPNNTTEDTKKYCDFLEKMTTEAPDWWVVGAPRFREMMEAGEIGGLKPTRLPGAYEIKVPSREPGRDIPVRVYKPDNGEPSKGIMLHAHGGGYCLGSHDAVDELLKFYANTCQLTAMSVGYRLAPEHPFPAGREDCIDVAEHLVDHGEADHGGKLLFLAGESGGAHMSVLVAFALIRSRPQHVLKGLVLPYGNYTIALGLPSMVGFDRQILINHEMVQHFMDAYTPGWTAEERQNPLASPLFDDLRTLAASTPNGKLPPALFMCGTNDPLLDDTLLMGVKWLASGSEAIIKIFPGAPHVYNGGEIDIAKESFGYEAEFILGRI